MLSVYNIPDKEQKIALLNEILERLGSEKTKPMLRYHSAKNALMKKDNNGLLWSSLVREVNGSNVHGYTLRTLCGKDVGYASPEDAKTFFDTNLKELSPYITLYFEKKHLNTVIFCDGGVPTDVLDQILDRLPKAHKEEDVVTLKKSLP